NYWLTADSSGKVDVAPNPTPSPRTGSITIARQTLFVQQKAMKVTPSIDFVAPADGAVGINAGVGFSASITSPNGLASVGLVDIQYGDSGCRFRFDYAKRLLLLFDDSGIALMSGQLASGSTARLQNK